MDVELFWNGERVGAARITPHLLDLGPIVVVVVPHSAPTPALVTTAFRARAEDGRAFTLDVVKVTKNLAAPGSATVSGYLRRLDEPSENAPG